MGSLAFCNLKRIMEENGIPPNGIVHVGAHKGEELGIYAEIGFPHIYLFEPNPGVYDELCEAVRNHVLPKGGSISVDRIAISTRDDRVKFAVPERSQLATLKPDTLDGLAFSTIVVESKPLSVFSFFGANVLVVDTQGTELDVLKSGDLSQFDLIVCEVTPKNAFQDIVAHLFAVGYVFHCWFQHDHNPELFDALFTRCRPKP